eukprot:gene11997-5397_t
MEKKLLLLTLSVFVISYILVMKDWRNSSALKELEYQAKNVTKLKKI